LPGQLGHQPQPTDAVRLHLQRRYGGAVWGTDVYTDGSDLCRAALHTGAIGAAGGAITVTRSEARAFYTGTSRNGVASNDYGSYDASIAFK
jgi:hypothetical protein